MPDDVYRWARASSLTPVVLFAASIPAAYLSSGLAVAIWLLAIPAGVIASRRAPDAIDDYFA